jgi:hypothetical protein
MCVRACVRACAYLAGTSALASFSLPTSRFRIPLATPAPSPLPFHRSHRSHCQMWEYAPRNPSRLTNRALPNARVSPGYKSRIGWCYIVPAFARSHESEQCQHSFVSEQPGSRDLPNLPTLARSCQHLPEHSYRNEMVASTGEVHLLQ